MSSVLLTIKDHVTVMPFMALHGISYPFLARTSFQNFVCECDDYIIFADSENNKDPKKQQ